MTHQVFVNICSWEQVPAPKSENDPIPVMAGELQEQVEEESTYTVVDIIFNPLVTKGVENSKDRKNLLIHVALDYLENTTSIQVTRKYKNLRIKFKGDPKQLLEYLKHRDEQGIKPHEPRQDTAGVSETPESLLIQLSSIGVSDMKSEKNPTVSLFETTNKPKKNLIEEISTTNSRDLPVSPNYVIEVKEATNTKPRRVLVKVDVPDVESSSQCQLHASMVKVILCSTICDLLCPAIFSANQIQNFSSFSRWKSHWMFQGCTSFMLNSRRKLTKSKQQHISTPLHTD